ncbi:ester cyclase [bacterium]|nr:ester cyclase [bacterium]
MESKELVRTLIEEAFNKGNLSVLEEIIHPEYEYWSPDSELKGIGQLTELIQGYRGAFPDLAVQIDDLFSSNDRICAAITFMGTHQHDFMGIPATKKSVEVHGMVISRVKDNKIIEEKEILDNLTFFQQLGVVPELS